MEPFKHYCNGQHGEDLLTSDAIQHDDIRCEACRMKIPLELVVAHIYQQLFEVKSKTSVTTPKKESIGKSRPFKLTDIVDYGKHRGNTIKYMIERSTQWVNWSLKNVDWFSLDVEATKHYWKYTDETPPANPVIKPDDEIPF